MQIREVFHDASCIHYDVSVRFGPLGGHGYNVTVTRTILGLRYKIEPTWIS